MSVLKRIAAVAAAMALALSFTGGSIATADVGPVSDEAVIVGSGTITPGLPSCFPDVTFSGTIALAGDETLNGPVNFFGTGSICETALAGRGNGNVGGVVAGNISYDRQGTLVTLSGNLDVNGELHTIVSGECDFTPTSANPISTFTLVCHVLLAS